MDFKEIRIKQAKANRLKDELDSINKDIDYCDHRLSRVSNSTDREYLSLMFAFGYHNREEEKIINSKKIAQLNKRKIEISSKLDGLLNELGVFLEGLFEK